MLLKNVDIDIDFFIFDNFAIVIPFAINIYAYENRRKS